jgi:beta-lactamase class A
VSEIDRAHPGTLSLYVQDVASGEDYGYGADAPSYLSSTIKLVVALEVLRQVDEGTLALGQTLPLRTEDVRDGVGPLGPEAVGSWPRVDELLELMLVRSDNSAADRLIALVGEAQLDAEVARRGLHFGPLRSLLFERHLLYGLLDPRGAQLSGLQLRELGRHESLQARAEAFAQLVGEAPERYGALDLVRAFEALYATGMNSAPAREMGALLAQVSRCEALSAASCERLHALMLRCRTGAARIRAGLPAPLPWAHQTGTQYQRACDVGFFLRAPGRPVVVVACARDFVRVPEAEAAFAELGRAVSEALGEGSPLPGGEGEGRAPLPVESSLRGRAGHWAAPSLRSPASPPPERWDGAAAARAAPAGGAPPPGAAGAR